MRLLYSDGATVGRSGPIQLLRLQSHFYVTGPGFLCAVECEDEGLQLVERLKAAQTAGDSLLSCLELGARDSGAPPR